MNTFQLSIVTPNGKIFEDQIISVRAPGAAGSFGVLHNHAPMIVSLGNGILKVDKGSSEMFFALFSGVFEVDESNNALILSDSVIEASSEEDAQEKLSEAVSVS